MTIFGADIEGEIKKSIAYLMGLPDADRIKVLASPMNLPQDRAMSLRALWQAITSNMALHERDVIVGNLVELGLDETIGSILVASIIKNGPTPAYGLKTAAQSIGGDFSSKYPEIIHEGLDNGLPAQQIASKLGLTAEQVTSTILATQPMLTACARGTPFAALHEYMKQAEIPKDSIDAILQVLKARYGHWQSVQQFRNTEATSGLVREVLEQNKMILAMLKEIMEAIRGKGPGDPGYVR